MVYKRGKRFGLSEQHQSLIYWTCVNFANAPSTTQRKILNLCANFGGEFHKELLAAVTTDKSITSIAYANNIDTSCLARKVKSFYQNW